jgi:hypothetical protein
MAFLTDLDSRAAIKGSRDPLGTQSIWVPLGRRVVGNLTTVSTSVRDFTVLILGFWFVQRALDEGSQESDLSLFLKWEQLCGYARVQTGAGGFRGIDRVKANLSQGSKVTLSADRAHQILGNQKIYGLWGLYTVPGRSSGLLSDDPLRLTPRARDFVERVYVTALTKAGLRDGDAIVRLLMPPSYRIDVDGREKPIMKAIGSLLRPDKYQAVEREFYDDVLVRGGPLDGTEGRQARLAGLLQKTSDDDEFAFTPAMIDQLIEDAGRDDKPGSLAERLRRIRHCETVLAPATRLFLYLLGRHGKRVNELAADIRKTWGVSLKHLDLPRIVELRQELVSIMGSPEAADRWLDIARDLAEGKYEDLIERLIVHNKYVMQQRGGAAPWIELKDERIHVAFRDEDGRLPERKELPSLWRSSYFLDSLRSVVGQVRGAGS